MGRRNPRRRREDLICFTSTNRRIVPKLIKLAEQYFEAKRQGDLARANEIKRQAQALRERNP